MYCHRFTFLGVPQRGTSTAVHLHLHPAPTCPADNPALYRHLVERLAHVLDLRAQSDPQVWCVVWCGGVQAEGCRSG